MRTLTVMTLTTAGFCFFSPVSKDDTIRITFSGVVTSTPCAISDAEFDNQFNLGVINTSEMINNSGMGKSTPQKFSLSLKNCKHEAKGEEHVKITLKGRESPYYVHNFLGLNQPREGVGLVIEKNGVEIKPDTPISLQKLVGSDNRIFFTAYIKGSGVGKNSVGEDVSASAVIVIEYE